MKFHRWMLVAQATCLAMILTACVAGTAGSTSPSQTNSTGEVASGMAKVVIQMTAFSPRELTVRRGTTVTWINQDVVGHNVLADDGSFKSEILTSGLSFTHTFNQPGDFPYYCSLHGGPNGEGMAGVIKVVP